MKKAMFGILRWMIRPAYLEDIEGDLHESYHEWKTKFGKTKANRLLTIEVLKLMRWRLVGFKSERSRVNQKAMITNYFKISFRNLLKYKGSNSLNIIGLSFGIACCVLCYLHIQFELNFDRFNTNYNSIHRLVAGNPADDKFWVKVAAPMSPTFKSQIPEIKEYVRLANASYNPKVLVAHENNNYLEPNFLMADPSLFTIFDFPALEGDPQKSLQDLNTVVITASIAKKLFGNESALGKVIQLKDNGIDFQVGAVVKDTPEQSHLRFDYLISFENLDRILGEGNSTSWGAYNYFAYVQLHNTASVPETQKKIHEAKHSLPNRELTFESIYLQSLKDIHFQDNRGNQLPSYDKRYIYVFATIALSLLVIACINFINLSIALSIKRIKEVGVRKVMGANRSQLILQFINEGIVTAFISLGLGLILLEGALPFINSLFGSELTTHYTDFHFLLFSFGITLVVGFISGSYLAFYVSGHQASSILKSGLKNVRGGLSLQKALVFIQFSISIILIVCSFIISNQMNFLQGKNLGFNHDQVITVPLSSALTHQSVEELKNQLHQTSSVVDVAASSFTPGTANWNQTVWWEGQTDPVSMFIISVDKDFLRTMGIYLIEGSMAQIESSKETQYILNQSAIDLIGWKKATGRSFSPFGENRKQPIAAVTSNFNFMSLHYQIAPLVLVISDDFALNQLCIKVAGSDMPSSIASIEETYQQVLGDIPFEYAFMDDRINQLYEKETRVKRIVSALTIVIAVFALLGVYGLISFSIENKTKEIAIRKVLGVGPKDLLILISKSYYKLMFIAFLVAVPIVLKVMTQWLNNFSYKVDINPYWYVIAFITVMLSITLIGMIKFISLREINPAQALKND
ncbi:MAG: FtsX-like permease family protein [Cyclobacteriaceae bacterium]